MKFLAALLGAASFAGSASAQCNPSTCAANNPLVTDSTPRDCNAYSVITQLSCDDLENIFSCDCSGCACSTPNDGGVVTDDFDDNGPTVEPPPPGGPGGTDPPPVDPTFASSSTTTHTEPAIVTKTHVILTIPDGTPPPPVEESPATGNAVSEDPHVSIKGVTTVPGLTRTTTTRTTPTSHIYSGDNTHPPVQRVVTTYISTSHRTRYNCDDSSACNMDTLGDSICEDSNNICACDWDGGDCCGNDNHYGDCTHCKCHDPNINGIIYNCPPHECEKDQWKGDGFCDDENNVCACNWDYGDCCGTMNHYGHCTDCLCRDPLITPLNECNGNCITLAYQGDGFCDDGNNNCACDWDGGDCCATDTMTVNTAHCDDCFCLDPDLRPDHPTMACAAQCGNQGHKGDGFCDDYNNLCGCDWDGGDCCGSQNKYTMCDDCYCLDEQFTGFYPPNCANSGGSCSNENYVNDAYCDDGNNNCACNWDGGDCCGAEHFFSHCTECECLDPGFLGNNCPGICEIKAYQGDGYCDDENNNCGCDWDGGDCCSPTAKTTHCADCLCLDPDVDNSCSGVCDVAVWVNDTHCDDGNNNCGCGWDGGDCCGSNGEAQQYSFCKDCLCKDPASDVFVNATDTCTGVCFHAEWKGDTICDDDNNNCGCDWDGGDCCGYPIVHKHCDDCFCLDPDGVGGIQCQRTCSKPAFQGDGFCDDNNNNCGCDWDGGDCCGDSNTYTTCNDCLCLDFNSNFYSTMAAQGPPEETQPPPVGNTDGVTGIIVQPPTISLPVGDQGTTPSDVIRPN